MRVKIRGGLSSLLTATRTKRDQTSGRVTNNPSLLLVRSIFPKPATDQLFLSWLTDTDTAREKSPAAPSNQIRSKGRSNPRSRSTIVERVSLFRVGCAGWSAAV